MIKDQQGHEGVPPPSDYSQPPQYPGGQPSVYPGSDPYGDHQGYPGSQGGQPPFGGFPNHGGGMRSIMQSQMQEMQELTGFDDKAVRRAFIRKVYGILMVQLIVTAGIMAVFMFVSEVKMFVREYYWLYYLAMGLTIVLMLVLVCCEGPRRTFPTNLILLGLFTVCQGFMLGTISTYYSVDAILIAVGITSAVAFCLTVFAFQTKIDFTNCGGMLCALLVILFISGFLLMFLPQTKWVMIGYGSLGALVFSLYIVYDTQMMMGGKHKYSLSPEEYIFAALNLYLDFINLFRYILMLVGIGGGMPLDMLTTEQLAELQQAFNLFDVDQGGTINSKELGLAMRSLGLNPTESELLNILNEYDTDYSGQIEFPEFCNMMEDKMTCVNDEEMIRMAFRVLDKKGQGHLEASSFKHLMTKIGERKLTEKEVDDIIAQADVDNDGDIDYEEFVKMLTII